MKAPHRDKDFALAEADSDVRFDLDPLPRR
jgi:hypothetical protein